MKPSRAFWPILLAFNKNSAASSLDDLPVPILKRRSLFTSSLKGFMFSWMLLSIFSKPLVFFIIRLAFGSWETSSFVVISNLLRTSERTSILTKWLSAHRCLADIEFVKYENPVFWLGTPALTVCSNVKSIGTLEKSFLVLLIPKQAFLSSS